MAIMGNYCKAYPISRFQKFANWSEKPGVTLPTEEIDGQQGQSFEAYAFLQENLVVTAGIFLDEDIVYDQITPEWERFCQEELQFETPEDVVAASTVGQEIKTKKEETFRS